MAIPGVYFSVRVESAKANMLIADYIFDPDSAANAFSRCATPSRFSLKGSAIPMRVPVESAPGMPKPMGGCPSGGRKVQDRRPPRPSRVLSHPASLGQRMLYLPQD